MYSDREDRRLPRDDRRAQGSRRDGLGPRARHDESHTGGRRQRSPSPKWTHDMYQGGQAFVREARGEGTPYGTLRDDRPDRNDNAQHGNAQSGLARDDLDPYASVRRSKAYDADEREHSRRIGDNWPVSSGRGVASTGASAPADRYSRRSRSRSRSRERGRRERSRSPRPSHDEYEWKSKAGGVAIFVRKEDTERTRRDDQSGTEKR